MRCGISISDSYDFHVIFPMRKSHHICSRLVKECYFIELNYFARAETRHNS